MPLIALSNAAHADAFIPTVASANIRWLFVFPVIVVLEGWLMARQKWKAQYKSALKVNLLSIVAELPFEVTLSMLGGYLASHDDMPRLHLYRIILDTHLHKSYFTASFQALA
ncbi:MAG: hypothetical protein ACLPWS_07185, partial [Rhodomicrobium sp.]